MKLIFIYGPPAAGKYTTGKELARITGFKFFHNHLTVPAVNSILPENTEKRFDLLKQIRLIILSKAAEEGLDTIFTLAYSGAIDDKSVAQIVNNIEKYGGQVCFVQLYASKEKLLSRIGSKSRKNLRMGKFTTRKALLESLATRDHYAAVKYKNNLFIDTGKSSAKESAAQIAQHFRLI
ncbi:MAG TPA: hypothetical protein VD947_01065 [Patescibacteria group bacterium]|nr:hypothetical protein [Patescibacteria group bacterium]